MEVTRAREAVGAEAAGARPCFTGQAAERVSDPFIYNSAAGQMVCQEGKRSFGRARVDNGDLYYFSVRDCMACPRRADCLTWGERTGTARARQARPFLGRGRVPSPCREGVAEGTPQAAGGIEPKFDEQMNRHGLRDTRYWGLAKVTVQVLLNVITVNLTLAVKQLAQATGPPGTGRGRWR